MKARANTKLKYTSLALGVVLFTAAVAAYFVVLAQLENIGRNSQGFNAWILGGNVPEQVHLSSTGK